jgi:hypothetical protein
LHNKTSFLALPLQTFKYFIKMKKNLLLFVCSTLLAINLLAQSTQTNKLLKNKLNTITTAVPFLLIAPDARGGGLGDAGVSDSPDANSMHWNPAKYAFIDKSFGFSVSYAPWLRKLVNDINLAYLAGYYRINNRQAIAASLRYFSLGNIAFTSETGEPQGQYKPNEFSLDVAYAYKFTNTLSGAVAFRYIYSNLTGGQFVGGAATQAGQTAASDVSLYYEKPIESRKMKSVFAFGLNISNIGAKISYTKGSSVRDFIPTNLRIGPSYTMNFDKNNSLALMIDLNKLLVPSTPLYLLDTNGQYVYDPNTGKIKIDKGKDPDVGIVRGMIQSFYDAPGGAGEELKEINYSFGLEYWYAKQFSIRAGYFNESATKGNRKYLTVGAGLRYSVFGLDFTYLIPVTTHNPLENTLRFSLLFNFDKVKGNKNADLNKEVKKNE